MVGISLGFIGTLLTIVQAGLLRIVIPKLGLPNSILTGLFFLTLALPLIGLVSSSWMLFTASVLYVCGGIGGPAIQSLISNLTPLNEQGQIQGGIASVISLTAIFGPLMMSNLFSFFTKENTPVYFPGAPFIMGGMLTLAAFFTAYIYFQRKPRTSQ